jgi:rRNA maturation endonuclease Nob1
MRFFRRKPPIEEEELRCPQCSERVPEGADHCDMCGADLRGLHHGSSERPVETAPDRALRF